MRRHSFKYYCREPFQEALKQGCSSKQCLSFRRKNLRGALPGPPILVLCDYLERNHLASRFWATRPQFFFKLNPPNVSLWGCREIETAWASRDLAVQ